MVPAFAQTTTSTTTTTTTSTSSTSTLPNGVTALYGADEFGTANAIANAEYPKGTSTAILASGLEANWVDSLTAAPLAAALKAPILLTSGVDTVGTETMAELTKLGVTKVILIGAVGDSVNAPKIEAELGSGITATTISGPTRFGTAGLVAQALAKIEGVTTFKTVFVASGEQGNLVDALAADPVAAEMGDPILLVPNTGDSSPIDANEDNYFNSATTGYLIGAAQGYLYNNAPSTLSLVPVYGQDRAGTAAAIDAEFAPKGGYHTLFITNGVDAHLVDALTAGPLMAMDNAAMAEVYSGTVPPSTTKLLASSILSGVTSMDVVGGPASIPSSLYDSSSSTLVSALPNLGLSPKITVANANVGEGSADALTLSGVPSNATVAWSITSSNASTGLVSGTSTGATFVGTAPGTYTIQASVNGVMATATVTVYGEAAGVTLTPASSSFVADGIATDAVTLNVVDSAGNTVSDFNGTVEVSTTASGVSFIQNGSYLGTNGVSVAVTNGTGTIDVGQLDVPGVSIPLSTTDLATTNGQSIVSGPSYGTATITSAPQVATSLKILGAPQYLDSNSVTSTSSPLTVVVEDQAGNPMVTGTVPITVSISGAGSLVGSSNGQLPLSYDGYTTTISPSAGIDSASNDSAPFNVDSIQGQTGPISITASASGLTSANATIQAVIAGVPSQLSASFQNGTNSFAEGPNNSINLDLTAQDAQGAPVSLVSTETEPVSITVTKDGSDASNINVDGVSAGSAVTENLNSNGTLSIPITDLNTGADAGTYTVTIAPGSGAGFSFPTQTLTFTETAAALSKVGFTPSGPIEVSLASPQEKYTLQLEDTYGNPVAQSGVTATVYASGTSTANSVYGTATVNGTTSPTPVTVTTNAQGQATVTLAAEAFPNAVWTLYASVAADQSAKVPSMTATSAGMTVSDQVPTSLSVSLQDQTDNSTGYAATGNTVVATLTLDDQYGAAIVNDAVPMQVTIPAGLSGGSSAPTGTTMANNGNWNQGQANTVDINSGVTGAPTVTTNSAGQITLDLTAWTAGSATVSAAVQQITTSVTGSGTIYVTPGTPTKVGLFYNGSPVGSSNELAVTANTPVAVSVEPTDEAGNPVAATYSEVVSLNAGATSTDSAGFESSDGGAPITSVVIPAGQSSVAVWYVNGTGGSYDNPTVTLVQPTSLTVPSSTASVALGGSTTVTANVYSGTPGPDAVPLVGQSVLATVSTNGGTVTSQAVSTTGGQVQFTYTAPSVGSGSAIITLTVPNTSLSKTITVSY